MSVSKKASSVPVIQNMKDWQIGTKILSVLGTTGSGKTRTVLHFVRDHFKNPKDVLIVSLDSVAVYKGLNIASAKPSFQEQQEFNFLGLDLFAIDQKVGVSEFKTKIISQVKAAVQSNRPVVFVGGSHFYERYLVMGASPGVASCSMFVNSLHELGLEKAYLQLIQLEPRMESKIHPNDEYRIHRYSDLMIRQKLSFEELFLNEKIDSLSAKTQRYIHCAEKKEDLILSRIYKMLDQGAVHEVRELLGSYSGQDPGLQTIGYKEIVEHLKTNSSQKQLVDALLISHRQLAKKQRTWLRSL